MVDPEFEREHKIETYKSMVTISMEVYKYLALLNGGAAAGMLAAADKMVRILPVHALRTAIACFIVGLLFDAFAMIFSYWTQNVLYNEALGRAPVGDHLRLIRVTMGACGVSLIAFCFGAGVAALSIQGV
ncbi:hypothetical protein ACS7SF_23905 (plasmid) [Ralstonia sp. 25C]|uniref:hypothetical protein n=1 Tax=Ralstonia sp. 25C TaxID=3447363 RepID=UPI003F754D85